MSLVRLSGQEDHSYNHEELVATERGFKNAAVRRDPKFF
jgi:hypothetical protein